MKYIKSMTRTHQESFIWSKYKAHFTIQLYKELLTMQTWNTVSEDKDQNGYNLKFSLKKKR